MMAMAFRWRAVPNIECWLGSFVIFQRIRTNIAKKLYIFVIFQGGGGSWSPAPLWIRTWLNTAAELIFDQSPI